MSLGFRGKSYRRDLTASLQLSSPLPTHQDHKKKKHEDNPKSHTEAIPMSRVDPNSQQSSPDSSITWDSVRYRSKENPGTGLSKQF